MIPHIIRRSRLPAPELWLWAQGITVFSAWLQVKNIQRPVVLAASLDNASGSASGQNTLSLRATTVISRAAFNMDKFEAVVDDSIAIEIKIRARVSLAG